jgi:hypothetical protein
MLLRLKNAQRRINLLCRPLLYTQSYQVMSHQALAPQLISDQNVGDDGTLACLPAICYLTVCPDAATVQYIQALRGAHVNPTYLTLNYSSSRQLLCSQALRGAHVNPTYLTLNYSSSRQLLCSPALLLLRSYFAPTSLLLYSYFAPTLHLLCTYSDPARDLV